MLFNYKNSRSIKMKIELKNYYLKIDVLRMEAYFSNSSRCKFKNDFKNCRIQRFIQ